MNINLKVRYYTEKHEWLCFTHAIQAAISGAKVETEVDDFDDEHDLRTTECVQCSYEFEERIDDMNLKLDGMEGYLRHMEQRKRLGTPVIQITKGGKKIPFVSIQTADKRPPTVRFWHRCCDCLVEAKVFNAAEGMIEHFGKCCENPDPITTRIHINGLSLDVETINKYTTREPWDGDRRNESGQET